MTLLKASWKPVAEIAVLSAAGFGAGVWYMSGEMARHELKAANVASSLQQSLSAERQARTHDQLDAERRYSSSLAEAISEQQRWQSRAEQLGKQLSNAQSRINQTQRELKEQQHAAVTKDGSHFTGIGPDSLRLYRTALGYSAAAGNAGHHGVSEATGGNAGNPPDASGAGGVNPVALLDSARSYGAWCLQMRNQLQALNEFYGDDGRWSQ